MRCRQPGDAPERDGDEHPTQHVEIRDERRDRGHGGTAHEPEEIQHRAQVADVERGLVAVKADIGAFKSGETSGCCAILR